jgi:hypothetical protein
MHLHDLPAHDQHDKVTTNIQFHNNIQTRGNTMKILHAGTAVLLACLAGSAFAQEVSEEEKNKVKKELDKPGGDKDQAILDKYFGAGVMANIDFGNRRRITTARVVNGIVRVDEENRAQLGFMLEAHKFISDAPNSGDAKKPYVHGPFIGLVMTNGSGIDTGVLGYMVGFRQPNTTNTFNLGVGLTISPRAQTLGDGLTADKPLPTGETEVRYKKSTLYGIAIIGSFGF